ncbi:hypothetical protein AB0L82_37535 [Nocardia sp. NPDC052001]|uniref:hypothetical protein n=1 Tax=Nocardia sp. NPDC052001 TaxID=3154853 RepID=UPI00342812B4
MHEDLEKAVHTHGFVRPGQEFDVREFADIVAPFLDVLLRNDFDLSPEWMREQVADIAKVLLSNVFRQMTLPPEFTVVARAAATCMGVLCQLRTEGPIREEFLTWWPGFAVVVGSYEARNAGLSQIRPMRAGSAQPGR